MKKIVAASLLSVALLSGCSVLETEPKKQQPVEEDTISLHDFRLSRNLEATRATFNGTLTVAEAGHLSVTLNEPGLINKIFHGDYPVSVTAEDGEVKADEPYIFSGVLLSNWEGTYTLTFTLTDDEGKILSESYQTFERDDIENGLFVHASID